MKLTKSLRNVAIALMLLDMALSVFQLSNAKAAFAEHPGTGKAIAIVLAMRTAINFSLCGIVLIMSTHALHGLKAPPPKDEHQ